MPYKSDAQRKYFHANKAKLESEGVNVHEWDEASKGKKLPEHTRKLAEGGAVRPSKYRAEDGGTHFIVHGDGKPFRIAKGRLSKSTHDRIMGMCKGGMVKGYSGEDGNPEDQVVVDPSVGAAPTSSGATPENIPAPVDWAGAGRAALQGGLQAMGPAGVPVAAISALPQLQDKNANPTTDEVAASNKANELAGKPAGPGPDLSAFAPSRVNPEDIPMLKVPGLSEAGRRDQAAAALELGKAKAAQDKEQSDILAAKSVYQQQSAKEVQDAATAWQARLQKQSEDLANMKVDPNHYWDSRGTAGKVGAAIGIILSGIGNASTVAASHGRGPIPQNLALQVIDKQIDQDIEAQKSNIGKAQNDYQIMRQQMGDDLSAKTMLRSEKLNAFATQLEMSAAKWQGGVHLAEAKMLAGQIRQEAAKDAWGVLVKQGEASYQNKVMKLQYGVAQNQAERAARIETLGQHGQIPKEATPYLDEKTRERAIETPEGGLTLLNSDKDRAVVTKQLGEADQYKSALDEMQRLRTKNNGVIGAWNLEDSNRFKSAAARLASLNAHADMGRVSEFDFQKYAKDVVPSNDLFDASFKGKLGSMYDDLDAKHRSIYGNYTSYRMPPTARELAKQAK